MKFTFVRKILTFLDQHQRYQSILLIFSMLLASLAELFGLGMVLLIINSFLGINNNIELGFLGTFLNDYFGSQNSYNDLYSILFLFFLVFTLKYFLLVFVAWTESDFVAKFREKISYKLYNNFLNRESSNLLKKNSAEYLRNFTEEISNCVLFYHCIIRIILDLIIFLAFLVFLLVYNPAVSTSVIAFFSLISITYYFSIKNKILNWAKQGMHNRKKKIQFINESFSAIKYIKILSSENYFLKKFKIQNSSLSKIIFKVNFINALPRYTLEYILFVSILALLFFLMKNSFSNGQIIQMLSIYTLAAFRVIPTINRILVSSQHIKFTHPSFEKLFIENKQPVIVKNKNPKRFNFKRNLKINIKKFQYDGKRDFFLKDIFINIPRNSKVGIIGPSGSGKSTLIDIICGFKKLKEKAIEVDGKCILSNLEGWQKIIGYVPQEVVILNQSLRENILFGSSSEKFSDKKIKKILDQVNLNQFFNKLPNGLSQTIKQDGQNISGGEKQRIGIARALLNDPELIVLDEATSALDLFTEAKVINTIKKLKKTIIIVSHRRNTLKFCGKVYSIKHSTLNLIKKLS